MGILPFIHGGNKVASGGSVASSLYDNHDSQSEKGSHSNHGSHLQEIAIEDTILILDFDLRCCESCVRELGVFAVLIFLHELLALPGYHKIDRCILVFAKIGTGHISQVNLNGFLVVIHDLRVRTQFHFELDLAIVFAPRLILSLRLIEDSFEHFRLLLGQCDGESVEQFLLVCFELRVVTHENNGSIGDLADILSRFALF